MFWNLERIKGHGLAARDEAIGRIVDVFFDDMKWTARHVAVVWLRGLLGRRFGAHRGEPGAPSGQERVLFDVVSVTRILSVGSMGVRTTWPEASWGKRLPAMWETTWTSSYPPRHRTRGPKGQRGRTGRQGRAGGAWDGAVPDVGADADGRSAMMGALPAWPWPPSSGGLRRRAAWTRNVPLNDCAKRPARRPRGRTGRDVAPGAASRVRPPRGRPASAIPAGGTSGCRHDRSLRTGGWPVLHASLDRVPSYHPLLSGLPLATSCRNKRSWKSG